MHMLAVIVGWPGLPPDVGGDDFGTLLLSVAMAALMVIIVFALGTVFGYAYSARSRKIRASRDVYRSYWRMFLWLLLALPACFVAIWIAFSASKDLLEDYATFRWEFSIEVGFITAFLCVVVSYFAIAFGPKALTPNKLRYRPKAWVK